MECKILGYIRAIRRLVHLIGLSPGHRVLDSLIVNMREEGASYSRVVKTSLALERCTQFIGDPIHSGCQKKPKCMVRGTLTVAEIKLMIAARRSVREKTMLSLLAYSGLRHKGLCGLNIAGVDIASQVIHVHRRKGQNDRDASITAPCAGLVLE